MLARYAAAYVATGVAFGLLDAVWLRSMANRLYRPEIGEMMAREFRMGPALVFYLLYIVGLIYFAVAPALAAGRGQLALVNGLALGFLCYMTYNLTNQAILKHWSLKVTLIDTAWGTVATGLAALAGWWVTTLIFGKS